jgi:hypothetical protein
VWLTAVCSQLNLANLSPHLFFFSENLAGEPSCASLTHTHTHTSSLHTHVRKGRVCVREERCAVVRIHKEERGGCFIDRSKHTQTQAQVRWSGSNFKREKTTEALEVRRVAPPPTSL